MASTLGARLRARIRRDGPVPWRDWMQACLYDADRGFYVAGQHPAGVGRGTHFATSPTLHPFFAQCIAREVAQAWRDAGKPPTWTVVEPGAGTGALARDAAAELRRLGVPADWVAVDVKDGQPIKGARWARMPPARHDCVVANEFLDALPFDVFTWRDGAWRSQGVGLSGERFAWADVPGAPPVAWGPGREGEVRVDIPGVQPWLARCAQAGVRLALIVDYGDARPGAEVRAFKGHDHADPLAEPGTVDLTADVDFAQLVSDGEALGFAWQLESQEQFLLRHKVFDVLNRIDRTTMQGASDYLRLRQLLLPTGFGAAFKVARLTRSA